jgi:molybdate/tungstate transport system permease protein
MELRWTPTLFTVLGLLILAVIVLPVIGVVVWQFAFDFGGFLQALGDPLVLQAVGLSLFAAFLAVGVAFVFGVPLAYMLARKDFRGKRLIEGAIDLPVVIPHTAAGIALLTIFGSTGLIGGPASSFLRFHAALPGIVVAMLFVSAPFLINSAKEGFRSVNPRMEKVARSLGASEWQAFSKVAFPLALPHIFTGAIMSWARAVSEFSAVIMLVGFFPMIAPGLIWSRWQSEGLMAAMAVSVLLIVVCLAVFVGLRHARGRFFAEH